MYFTLPFHNLYMVIQDGITCRPGRVECRVAGCNGDGVQGCIAIGAMYGKYRLSMEGTMSVDVIHDTEKNRLELVFRGYLDTSVGFSLLGASTYLDERLQTCIIDTTRVTRVFDSGVALILVMLKRLQKLPVQLVIVGDIPGLPLPDSGIDTLTRIGNSYPKAYKFARVGKSHDLTDEGETYGCSGSGNCRSGNGHSCGCTHGSTALSAHSTTAN